MLAKDRKLPTSREAVVEGSNRMGYSGKYLFLKIFEISRKTLSHNLFLVEMKV